MNPIEIVGLLGTVLILCSFVFDDSRWIRIGNMIGSVLFVIYGIYIGALSTWILNGACILLNIYKLTKQYLSTKQKTEIKTLEAIRQESSSDVQ